MVYRSVYRKQPRNLSVRKKVHRFATTQLIPSTSSNFCLDVWNSRLILKRLKTVKNSSNQPPFRTESDVDNDFDMILTWSWQWFITSCLVKMSVQKLTDPLHIKSAPTERRIRLDYNRGLNYRLKLLIAI